MGSEMYPPHNLLRHLAACQSLLNATEQVITHYVVSDATPDDEVLRPVAHASHLRSLVRLHNALVFNLVALARASRSSMHHHGTPLQTMVATA